MKICISGLSGSGKNSVGSLVAQKLGFRLVNPTFKTIAKKQKMDLLAFHKKAEADHGIDKKFDDSLIKEASGGNCVVTTWLGPWMIKDADIRVWLYAPSSARAARVAGRDGMQLPEAQKHISERDESNHLRYLEIYKIDIYDHSGFDLVINTERFLPVQSAEIIAAAANVKGFAVKGAMKKAPKKGKKSKRRK
jgi:cytidylate kinase